MPRFAALKGIATAFIIFLGSTSLVSANDFLECHDKDVKTTVIEILDEWVAEMIEDKREFMMLGINTNYPHMKYSDEVILNQLAFFYPHHIANFTPGTFQLRHIYLHEEDTGGRICGASVHALHRKRGTLEQWDGIRYAIRQSAEDGSYFVQLLD